MLYLNFILCSVLKLQKLYWLSLLYVVETLENTTNSVNDFEDERFLMKNIALFTNFLAVSSNKIYETINFNLNFT